jgi:transposase
MIRIKEILRLKSMGINISAISRSCNCTRNTVREVLRRAEKHNLQWPLPDNCDDSELMNLLYPTIATPTARKQEPDYEYIHRELGKPHVNLRLLWTEYKEIVPDGLEYSQFCNRYRQWAAKTKAVMHITRKPGEELFVDWAGSTMQVIDRDSGEILTAYLFVASLGTSGYPYVEAFQNQKLESWIMAHVHAFEYYGGIPRILVPDNLKTGIKNPCNYNPVENRTYFEMAEYYGTAIVPARVKKPRDKSPVEGTVGDISTWIIAALRNRKFFSFAELNEAIRQKLREFSEKPFQKRDGSRKSVFIEFDKPALLPLPVKPYEIASWKIATVSFNYHIEIDKNYYSVPYTYIQKKVDVRTTQSVVEVFYNGTRICSHPRLYGRKGQYSTIPDHMPPNHREYLSWDRDRFIAWACRIGDHTREAVQQILASKKVEQQAYKSCFGLLKLADKYSAVRLENACKKALELKSPSYTTVNNILKNGMDKIVIPSGNTLQNVVPIHKNIRGSEYYAKGGGIRI